MRTVIKYKLALTILTLISICSTASVSAATFSPTVMAPLHSFAAVPGCDDVTPSNVNSELDKKAQGGGGLDCILKTYVDPAVNVLSGLAGIIVVANIAIGGIQYSSAGGDPGKVSAAKSRITKAILALVAFIFLYAFINFILPGGING